MNPVERLLATLREHGCDSKRSGSGWECRCPAHDDREPSLNIGTGDDGKALVNCHAGCSIKAICGAVGLRVADLFPDDPSRSNGHHTPRHRVPVTNTPRNGIAKGGSGDGDGGDTRKRYPTAREAVAELERRLGKREGLWTYRNAAGEPVFVVVRFATAPAPDNPESKPGKTFRPVSLVAGGWIIGDPPGLIPLYHLPELLGASLETPVVVCEGEKAAEAARGCGLLATTSAHGCKSADKSDWSPMAGRVVWISSDHDEAGERYAEDVSRLALAAGARSVCIVRLADHWPELPKGGDMVDALELAGGDADAVRGVVEALAVEVVSHAAEPEDGPTPIGPARFVPFPVAVLPEPIRSYVVDGAKALGCDASFVALPMLSGLASAIGNTHRLELKRSWIEPAILWTAIVGESGTIKSPALELALRAVRKRQQRAMKEHAEAIKTWEVDYARWEIEHTAWKQTATQAAKANTQTDDPPEAPEKPTCPRTWTDDTTTEALVARLQENPRGLLMVRDELSGWFNFDRYSGGKGGGDAAKWLEVFGGRSLIVDRKMSGTEYVPRASVSIAGGIQPETLRRALGQEHRDSGLAARLLFAMPPRKAKRWTEDDLDERTEAAVAAVFDRLYALEPATDAEGDPAPRLLTLSTSAKRTFVRFVNEHGAEQAERVGDEAAAWSKLEGYAARFALVLHLTRVAAGDPAITDPGVIDEASIAAGVVLVRWFAGEAERVYANLEASNKDREHARLAEWIEGRGGSVTAGELSKGLRAYRGDSAKARDALAALAEAGFGVWKHDPPSSKGGRPTQRFTLCPRVPVTETPAESIENRGIGDGDGRDTPEDDGWGEV